MRKKRVCVKFFSINYLFIDYGFGNGGNGGNAQPNFSVPPPNFPKGPGGGNFQQQAPQSNYGAPPQQGGGSWGPARNDDSGSGGYGGYQSRNNSRGGPGSGGGGGSSYGNPSMYMYMYTSFSTIQLILSITECSQILTMILIILITGSDYSSDRKNNFR